MSDLNKTMQTLTECCECNWVGFDDDQKQVRDNRYKTIKVFDQVCPECGHKEFYRTEPYEQCIYATIEDLKLIIKDHNISSFELSKAYDEIMKKDDIEEKKERVDLIVKELMKRGKSEVVQS